jgi:hypothetical protein
VNVLPPKLGDIAKLYAQTKRLILTAEELDPELRSCIPIIKELRDAFDHLMRYVSDYFTENPKGPEYQDAQLDKALGHVFRASYDAMDSLAILLKLRLHKAMTTHSHEAITVVFPEYFNTHIVKLREIDNKVIESRRFKDVGGYTPEHLDEYLNFLDQLQKICIEAESRVTEMVRFDKAQKNKSLFQTILTLLGLVIAFLVGYLLKLF